MFHRVRIKTIITVVLTSTIVLRTDCYAACGRQRINIIPMTSTYQKSAPKNRSRKLVPTGTKLGHVPEKNSVPNCMPDALQTGTGVLASFLAPISGKCVMGIITTDRSGEQQINSDEQYWWAVMRASGMSDWWLGNNLLRTATERGEIAAWVKQETHISHRNRAMLHVNDYK